MAGKASVTMTFFRPIIPGGFLRISDTVVRKVILHLIPWQGPVDRGNGKAEMPWRPGFRGQIGHRRMAYRV